jgi:hypothetical protein
MIYENLKENLKSCTHDCVEFYCHSFGTNKSNSVHQIVMAHWICFQCYTKCKMSSYVIIIKSFILSKIDCVSVVSVINTPAVSSYQDWKVQVDSTFLKNAHFLCHWCSIAGENSRQWNFLNYKTRDY